MIHIPDVHFDPFVPFNKSSAVNLCPTGDAGAHVEHTELLFAVMFDRPGVVCKRGAGADETHIAAQNVDELGQFVNAGGTEQFAHASDAGVILAGIDAAAGVLGVDLHTAELQHLKHATVPTDPFLTEMTGPSESNLMSKAAINKTGHEIASRRNEQTISEMRFMYFA